MFYHFDLETFAAKKKNNNIYCVILEKRCRYKASKGCYSVFWSLCFGSGERGDSQSLKDIDLHDITTPQKFSGAIGKSLEKRLLLEKPVSPMTGKVLKSFYFLFFNFL